MMAEGCGHGHGPMGPHGLMEPPDPPENLEAPEGVDELSFHVFRSLMSATKLNGRLLGRTMSTHGAHPGQAGMLWMLSLHEGVSQRELAERVRVAPPTATAMLQKMERNGLIERTGDEADQRVTRLRLTESGRELSDELRRAHGSYIGEVIGAMPAKDRAELARLLDELSNNIKAALERLED